ncbi:MAG TPA: hydrolase [Candidatus Cybelea sp.]|nr:hydrolase [Candidatus Cybelea sp.]
MLDRARSLLLVVDVQERLLPAMADPAAVVEGCGKLMRGAARLSVPILVTEQYPSGLGPTVPALKSLAPDQAVVAKVHFSGAADPGIAAWLQASGRSQAVLCGLESHVCVQQTALQLKAQGWEVFVAGDAISSRRRQSMELAVARMRERGCEIVDVEMVLFEWLGKAGTSEFKDLSRIIK